jgi:signal transduction histidine kinase/CheY-like chemotaxis protein/HPt (histidine-containing phosphotransfer) domain-containing protein
MMREKTVFSRSYIYIVCFLILCVIAFSGVVHTVTSQTLKQQIGKECLGIASAVAALLEEDPWGYREFIKTLDTESGYYIRTKAIIEKIRLGNADNIAFLYTEMRISENDIMYLFSGEKAGDETFVQPGAIEPITPARRRAYDSERAYVGDFVTTALGTFMSAYAPVFNTDTGEFLGFVGADVSVEQYDAVMHQQFAIIICSAIMVTIMCFFIIRLNRDKLRAETENISKSSFLTRMNHEIRTPLNTIIGMSELISHKEIPRDMFEYVATIRQAGSNLLSIVNDILDFSEIEAERTNIASEKYYFASVICDVVNLTRARLMDKPLAFSVKVDGNIPERLIGDEVRTKQILLNLLSNAVKYTYSGHISLDIRFENIGSGQIRLEFIVEDSGIGIKQTDIDKLFRDFVRIENTGMREVEGTGLGLAITRRLCRAMGGDVSVKSEYGRGSKFTATIIQTQDADSDKKLAFVHNAENCRVLIFEERPIYLGDLVYALTNLGVNPICAQNLADFKGKLEEGGYDYAFVASKYISDGVFAIGKKQLRTVLVNMVEMNDVPAYNDINSVTMPIFCVTAANVLNGVKKEETPSAGKHRPSFKAPDAKVLIVDDISTNLRVSKELMSLYGLEVHTCLSGPEAISLAQINHYDIIFMDHMMPDMDGVEAASAIRAIDPDNGYYQTLPIVMLTANTVSGQREMFLRNGMNDFLAKPIDFQKLDSILQRWLPEEKKLDDDAAEPGTYAQTGHIKLFEIPGVSVETGLNNTGGSIAAYQDILAIFCMDADEKVGQIEQCIVNRDFGLYMTMVHALKSASRSIGAMEFGDFAARLEEAARVENTSVIAEETDAFLSATRALADNIRGALEQKPAEQADGDDLTELQLATLRSALTDMDIASANRLIAEYMKLQLNGNARRALSDIENHILLFDYDKAIEKIDSL